MDNKIYVRVCGTSGDSVWVKDRDGKDFEISGGIIDVSVPVRAWYEIDASQLKEITREKMVLMARKDSLAIYAGKTDELFKIFAGEIAVDDWIDGYIRRNGEYEPLFPFGFNCMASYQVIVLDLLRERFAERGYPKKKPADSVKEEEEEEEVLCSCGHLCPKSMVMSASSGTSCPECYDEMSE
jgi:hypothetical protein